MKVSSIIFDWKRTLYNPDNKTLIDGAFLLLNKLHNNNIPLFLIGKGDDEMYKETERLGVSRFFDRIKFAPGEKDPENFVPHIDKTNPSSMIVVGDRIRSELTVGKNLGATTIWLRQGKFADELPENDSQKPDFEVSSIKELDSLLVRLLPEI